MGWYYEVLSKGTRVILGANVCREKLAKCEDGADCCW
jgi:hypothetical protein